MILLLGTVLLVLVLVGLYMSVRLGQLPVTPKVIEVSPLVTTVEDEHYLLVRHAAFKPDHASGLAARKAVLLTALRNMAQFDKIKDWTAAEQTAAETFLLKMWRLYQEYVAQKNIRMYAPEYVSVFGSDTTSIWTDISFFEFEQGLAKLALPYVQAMADLVYYMNPIIHYSPRSAPRNLRDGFALSWCPSLALADAISLRTTLITNIEAMNWFAKIGFQATAGDLLRVWREPRILEPGYNNEYLFWNSETPIYYRTTVDPAVGDFVYPLGDPNDDGIENTEYYFLPNTSPFELYALKRMIHCAYDVTNNPIGALYTPDEGAGKAIPGFAYADDTWGISLIKFAGNAVALNSPDNTVSASYLSIWANVATGGGASLKAQNVYNSVWRQTTSAAAWTNSELNFMCALFAGAKFEGGKAGAKFEGGKSGNLVDDKTGSKKPRASGNRPRNSTNSKSSSRASFYRRRSARQMAPRGRPMDRSNSDKPSKPNARAGASARRQDKSGMESAQKRRRR